MDATNPVHNPELNNRTPKYSHFSDTILNLTDTEYPKFNSVHEMVTVLKAVSTIESRIIDVMRLQLL